jgi:transposase
MGRIPRANRLEIQSLYQKLHFYRAVASRLKVSLKTVRRWVTRGAGGSSNVADFARSGRPHALRSEDRTALKRIVLRGGTATEDLAQRVDKGMAPVHLSTISRAMKAGGQLLRGGKNCNF